MARGIVYVLTGLDGTVSKIGSLRSMTSRGTADRAYEYGSKYGIKLRPFAEFPTEWPRDVEGHAIAGLASLRLPRGTRGGIPREIFRIPPEWACDAVIQALDAELARRR